MRNHSHLHKSNSPTFTFHSLISQGTKNMGDLHSIPNFSTNNTFSYHSTDMKDTSPLHSDDIIPSGYLEDALFEFRSKRRRLLLFDDDVQHQQFYENSSYWNSKSFEDIDDCYKSFSKFYPNDNGEERKVKGIGRLEEMNSSSSMETTKSSSNSTLKQAQLSSSFGKNEERMTKLVRRVVYPFALVKPGGFRGDMTLNDINQRILMPPTRPLKHPVGDFACRPLVFTGGLGLSGKAVVALTRIHTQGRGTITIIRTKN